MPNTPKTTSMPSSNIKKGNTSLMPPTITTLHDTMTETSEECVVAALTSIHKDVIKIRALQKTFFQYNSVCFLATIIETWKTSVAVHLAVLSILSVVTRPDHYQNQPHGAILKLTVACMTHCLVLSSSAADAIALAGNILLSMMSHMEEDLGAQLANNFLVRNHGLTVLYKSVLAWPTHTALVTSAYLLVEYMVGHYSMFEHHFTKDKVQFIENAYKTLPAAMTTTTTTGQYHATTTTTASNMEKGSVIAGKA